MSFWTRMRNLLKIEPPNPLAQQGLIPQQFVPRDLRLSQEEMLCLSVVWGCVRLVVDSLASLEWKVYTRNDANNRKQILDDDVAWMFNVRPNPDQTAQAMKEMLLTQAILDGDGFGYINFNNAQKPAQVWPLDSLHMQTLRNRETQELIYRYTHPDMGAVVDLQPYEVFHLRGPSVRRFTGDSIVYRAAKAIALGAAQERYATGYYGNGATPGLILKPPPTALRKADPNLDKRLKAEWREAHGHARGGGNTVAIGEPGWDYQVIDSDAMKSQIVPARQFSVEDVARYFGVPLVLLGVQAAAQGYGTNVSQLYVVFARNGLLPWTNRITEEAQFKFYPQRKPWKEIELDLTPLMRGDEVQKEQADEIAIKSGKMTLNEVRGRDGLNSIGPPGDVTLIETRFQTLEKAIKDAEAPPAPAAPANPSPPKLVPVKNEDDGLARAAVALDRYGRRMMARRIDLERRHEPDKVEEYLQQERKKIGPTLVKECRQALDALDSDILAIAESVEAGEPAHLAAQRLAYGRETRQQA